MFEAVHICHVLAEAMVIIGVSIIILGALKTLLLCFKSEFSRQNHHGKSIQLDILRSHFGAYLLMGLEFSVGADIILTMLEPSKDGLLILGGLVVIRTFIAFFLERERRDIRQEIKEEHLNHKGETEDGAQ